MVQASSKKVLYIGQAPPRIPDEVPFGRTKLYSWLENVGISREQAVQDFAFTALVTSFPGMRGRSHRPPHQLEITANRARLVELIARLQSPIIVTVGSLSARAVLGRPNAQLEDIIGKMFVVQPFAEPSLSLRKIIPLPHPSGASAWIHQKNHRELLGQALRQLRNALD